MIFDTHAHYLASRFDADRDELLSNMPLNGVDYIVECGTDFQSSRKAIELTQRYTHVYAAVGIHPESLIEQDASTVYKYKGDWQKEMQDIERLLSHAKCVAIGECGLDYHWPVPKDEQNAMFRAHLQLAKKHSMPIIVHDREAHADVYALLEEYCVRGVVHCYSGSAADAVRLAKNGMHFGFGGAATFKNAKKALEAAAQLPLDKILLETDCPYMAPEPYRAKRCDSTMISFVAQAIANARGDSAENILTETRKNAKRFFNID